MGGPIYIPKIYNGHNKTFWFFNYEEFLETNLYGFNDTVPTANYLAGQFLRRSHRTGLAALAPSWEFRPRRWALRRFKLTPPATSVFANEIFDPATRAVATSGALAGQGYATPFPNNIDSADPLRPGLAEDLVSFVPPANNASFCR